MKRFRTPKAKPGEIKVQYGKLPHDSPDMVVAFGEGTSKRDGRYMLDCICGKRMSLNLSTKPGEQPYVFENSLIEELAERGYDITTLKVSIQKRAKEEG